MQCRFDGLIPATFTGFALSPPVLSLNQQIQALQLCLLSGGNNRKCALGRPGVGANLPTIGDIKEAVDVRELLEVSPIKPKVDELPKNSAVFSIDEILRQTSPTSSTGSPVKYSQ
ncbi:hypothetical protein AAVH_38850, partial [Aphelenchoides avenae]